MCWRVWEGRNIDMSFGGGLELRGMRMRMIVMLRVKVRWGEGKGRRKSITPAFEYPIRLSHLPSTLKHRVTPTSFVRRSYSLLINIIRIPHRLFLLPSHKLMVMVMGMGFYRMA
jgi:hypothetical protein